MSQMPKRYEVQLPRLREAGCTDQKPPGMRNAKWHRQRQRRKCDENRRRIESRCYELTATKLRKGHRTSPVQACSRTTWFPFASSLAEPSQSNFEPHKS